MFHRLVRVSISLSLQADGLRIDDLETPVTKLMELMLRCCDVSWGPTVGRTQQSYGETVTVETQAPCLHVEIDVFHAADYAIATVQTLDPRLIERMETQLLEVEAAAQGDTDFICRTGRSHPDFGYMMDCYRAWTYQQDRHDAFARFDGPVTDKDGNSLDEAEPGW